MSETVEEAISGTGEEVVPRERQQHEHFPGVQDYFLVFHLKMLFSLDHEDQKIIRPHDLPLCQVGDTVANVKFEFTGE